MMKKIAVCCGVAVCFACAVAFAGFSIPGVSKGTDQKAGSGLSPSAEAGDSDADAIIKAYIDSTQDFATSLEFAGEAFGVKKEVLEKTAVMKALNEGNLNKKELDKVTKVSEEALQIIDQKMKETNAPTAQAKALFAKSMTSLTGGLTKEAALAIRITAFGVKSKDQIQGGGFGDRLKTGKELAKVTGVLGTTVPIHVKIMKGALSSNVAYAKAHQIAIPKDATKLLKE